MTRALFAKTYHRAALVAADGSMSALCFKVPHAIDLRRASWTIRDEAVTCPRCKAAMKAKALAEDEAA